MFRDHVALRPQDEAAVQRACYTHVIPHFKKRADEKAVASVTTAQAAGGAGAWLAPATSLITFAPLLPAGRPRRVP